jgi:hypothetical protein
MYYSTQVPPRFDLLVPTLFTHTFTKMGFVVVGKKERSEMRGKMNEDGWWLCWERKKEVNRSTQHNRTYDYLGKIDVSRCAYLTTETLMLSSPILGI